MTELFWKKKRLASWDAKTELLTLSQVSGSFVKTMFVFAWCVSRNQSHNERYRNEGLSLEIRADTDEELVEQRLGRVRWRIGDMVAKDTSLSLE